MRLLKDVIEVARFVMPSLLALWGIFGLMIIALLLMVTSAIFKELSPKDATPEYLEWITKKSGGSKFNSTLASWGFFKASFRRFINEIKLFIFPQPQATQGQKAPDCRLVDVKTGGELWLLRDFVDKCPSGVPLVLNMGSYT